MDVKNCPRCGLDHAQVQFHALDNPPQGITHWAMCVAACQPILLANARPVTGLAPRGVVDVVK